MSLSRNLPVFNEVLLWSVTYSFPKFMKIQVQFLKVKPANTQTG